MPSYNDKIAPNAIVNDFQEIIVQDARLRQLLKKYFEIETNVWKNDFIKNQTVREGIPLNSYFFTTKGGNEYGANFMNILWYDGYNYSCAWNTFCLYKKGDPEELDIFRCNDLAIFEILLAHLV